MSALVQVVLSDSESVVVSFVPDIMCVSVSECVCERVLVQVVLSDSESVVVLLVPDIMCVSVCERERESAHVCNIHMYIVGM